MYLRPCILWTALCGVAHKRALCSIDPRPVVNWPQKKKKEKKQNKRGKSKEDVSSAYMSMTMPTATTNVLAEPSTVRLCPVPFCPVLSCPSPQSRTDCLNWTLKTTDTDGRTEYKSTWDSADWQGAAAKGVLMMGSHPTLWRNKWKLVIGLMLFSNEKSDTFKVIKLSGKMCVSSVLIIA